MGIAATMWVPRGAVGNFGEKCQKFRGISSAAVLKAPDAQAKTPAVGGPRNSIAFSKAPHPPIVPQPSATWLPMALYTLPLSPNNHPTTAQEFPRVVGGHYKIVIFQPIYNLFECPKCSF